MRSQKEFKELADDEEYLFHWTRRMSFDDRQLVLTMKLLESREFDHWTNRMVIESLRDLADELESECTDNENEICKSVDH